MTSLIILAAGPSSRLGHPKQTLQFEGRSLLQHSVDEGLKSMCSIVFVVLGANIDVVRPDIESKHVQIVYNSEWEKGLSSSIKCGLNNLLEKDPQSSSCILMVCDQPFVNHQLLDKLIQEKQNSEKNIIACRYDNTVGTPALFDRKYFPELLLVEKGGGAKNLILKNSSDACFIDFTKGGIDIDTPQDYADLLKNRLP